MARTAYLVLAKWPWSELSTTGKTTVFCNGGTESHVGIFFPNCTEAEVRAHSHPDVSHSSAIGQSHVCFDYIDKRARFQSCRNERYFTSASTVLLYPILGADASEIHRACLEAAVLNPYNSFFYRLNVLAWCWPCSCCPANGLMAPSTCVALSLRVIARTRSEEAFYSDQAVQRELGIDTFGPCTPCHPATLNGHTPRSALEALQAAYRVGPLVGSFEEAIAGSQGRLRSTPIVYFPVVSGVESARESRPVLNLLLR
tara:strand:- start:6211 stop:6981 length:771 start_codon:yes stop_codon:yes gene_type:complete